MWSTVAVDLLALGLGEEADMAEVDAEQGHAGAPRVLGAAQDGAVAAEDDDELAPSVGSSGSASTTGPMSMPRNIRASSGGEATSTSAARSCLTTPRAMSTTSGRVGCATSRILRVTVLPVTRRFGRPRRRWRARRTVRRDVS